MENVDLAASSMSIIAEPLCCVASDPRECDHLIGYAETSATKFYVMLG